VLEQLLKADRCADSGSDADAESREDGNDADQPSASATQTAAISGVDPVLITGIIVSKICPVSTGEDGCKGRYSW